MIHLPLNTGTSKVTADSLEEFYELSASAPTGGMYPVGANGLWHGGVHLSTGEEPPVHAPIGGRLVAARLDPDPERATCAFGDTNFLITRHNWPPTTSDEDGTPFYMLFMHLASRPLEGVARQPSVAPWLTGQPLRRVTAESGLNVRYRPHPEADREGGVPTGNLVKPRGKPTEQAGYRWQEVGVLRQDLDGYVALGPLAEDGLQTSWTEKTRPPGDADLVDRLESGDVVKLDVRVHAGEMLWWGGSFGQDFEWSDTFEAIKHDAIANTVELMGDDFEHPDPIERAPSIHWEVFSAEKVFGHEDDDAAKNDHSESNHAHKEGSQDGADGAASEGTPQTPDWTERVVSSDVRTFDPEESEALSLIERVREESEIPDPAAYRSCSLDEKKSVYLLDAGKELRTYAVKNVSEWAVEDVDRAAEESPGRQPSDKEDLKALQWWQAAEEAGVELPESRKVWHYHPVTALKALASRRPRFFAEVGQKKEVATYEDVRDAVFDQHGVPEHIDEIDELYRTADEADVPEYDTVVTGDLDETDVVVRRPATGSADDFASVEAGRMENEHGVIAGWKRGVYDFASDTPDLYDMLIDEEKMLPNEPERGVPELTDFDARVWAALSESEACLKGINTWDRALVTIGPIQQTLGVGPAKGELQGALHTAWRHAPDAYRQCLGRYGLMPKDDSMEIVQGAKKGHVTLRGEVLDNAAKKKRLQQFEWVHRLAEAFGDPDLRYWMLCEGFRRLQRLRERKVTLNLGTETIQTTIGEIFRRDLSQALLLDWHVNAPALVWQDDETNQWQEPVQNLLTDWGAMSASHLTETQELQLMATLLPARIGNMANPARRAFGILQYTENDVVKNLAVANQPPGSQSVSDFLNRVIGLENSYESDQKVWATIRSHRRKTLSFTSY